LSISIEIIDFYLFLNYYFGVLSQVWEERLTVDLNVAYTNQKNGTDALECPRCGSEMKIMAVIVDLRETEKILKASWLRSTDLLPISTQLL